MTIPVHYQNAINLVDPTKVLVFTVDPSYGGMEYSYSGLSIVGGSDSACCAGASALLDAMGFRFYAPPSRYWKLPSTIRTDLSRGRGENWIPGNVIFLVYGHSWAGSHAASRALLNNAYTQWKYLAGCNDSSYPAGHRWGNIISNSTAFFTENPDLVKPLGLTQTFDLDGIVGTPRYDVLVEYCAAFLLRAGLNEFSRTHMDGVDGDGHEPDVFYPFTLAVASKMRTGTAAIGGIPAQAGVPSAQIGVYAYAGHRLPPTLPYKPGVYTQVALAFNSTDLTYAQLIEQHGALADAIALREYLDTQVWSGGRPFNNGRANPAYLNTYNGYQPYGVREVNSEFTANWLVNMVFARAAILKFRTGSIDYPAIIQEIAANIYNNDAAVIELFNYWADSQVPYSKYSLRQSFDIVAKMATSWYKTEFQQLLTIYWLYHKTERAAEYGIVRAPGEPGDTFAAAISKLLSWVVAVRDSEIMHSYAFMRQEANSALRDYPHLIFNATPEPAWFASPALPTSADWTEAYADIVADTIRDPALDGTDLAVKTVAPVASGSTTPATAYYCDGVANYIVLGPSTLTVTDVETNETETVSFGNGYHKFGTNGQFRVEWNGGVVFLDTFPMVRKDPDGTALRHWLYVPASAAGRVDLRPASRWSFYDEETARKDWTPSVQFPDLGPGQVAVDNDNTRGTITNGNCNRYLSPRADIALMPRDLAARGGAVSFINVVEDPEAN